LIDYRTEDFEARARQIIGGRGVGLILDAIGGDSLRKGYRLLAPTGRLGMFGLSSAAANKTGGCSACCPCSRARPSFNCLMNASKGVFGVNLGHMDVVGLRGPREPLLGLSDPVPVAHPSLMRQPVSGVAKDREQFHKSPCVVDETFGPCQRCQGVPITLAPDCHARANLCQLNVYHVLFCFPAS
jgi:Zinc-binding dehydrogenase